MFVVIFWLFEFYNNNFVAINNNGVNHGIVSTKILQWKYVFVIKVIHRSIVYLSESKLML